ncbi:MAG: hypothetical protein AAF267_15530 [Deinococcota bacterium]
MTTQGLKRGLEADAWLASVIQNLHDLSDKELLEAGCHAGEDVLVDANSSTPETALTSSISDDVVGRYLSAQHDKPQQDVSSHKSAHQSSSSTKDK